jgi:hypothetical protein
MKMYDNCAGAYTPAQIIISYDEIEDKNAITEKQIIVGLKGRLLSVIISILYPASSEVLGRGRICDGLSIRQSLSYRILFDVIGIAVTSASPTFHSMASLGCRAPLKHAPHSLCRKSIEFLHDVVGVIAGIVSEHFCNYCVSSYG